MSPRAFIMLLKAPTGCERLCLSSGDFILSSIYAIESLSAVESFPNTMSSPFHQGLFSLLKSLPLLLHFAFSKKRATITNQETTITYLQTPCPATHKSRPFYNSLKQEA